jgi:hypothetical protein
MGDFLKTRKTLLWCPSFDVPRDVGFPLDVHQCHDGIEDVGGPLCRSLGTSFRDL